MPKSGPLPTLSFSKLILKPNETVNTDIEHKRCASAVSSRAHEEHIRVRRLNFVKSRIRQSARRENGSAGVWLVMSMSDAAMRQPNQF